MHARKMVRAHPAAGSFSLVYLVGVSITRCCTITCLPGCRSLFGGLDWGSWSTREFRKVLAPRGNNLSHHMHGSAHYSTQSMDRKGSFSSTNVHHLSCNTVHQQRCMGKASRRGVVFPIEIVRSPVTIATTCAHFRVRLHMCKCNPRARSCGPRHRVFRS